MTWGSHMSNFHGVTQYGSKICHATVTGVTGVTQPIASCDSAPPFGPSPWRPCKRRKNMYIHVRVRLEKSLEKVKKKVEKNIPKKFTSCPSKREKKKYWYFPRGQRPERGLRLPKVLLKLPPTPNQWPNPS